MPGHESFTNISLIGRVAGNPSDARTWGEFVDRYAPKVYRWCRVRGLQDADAEDVTQVVLLKLSMRMRHFVYDPTKSFRAWLRTLAHHAWADLLAERARSGGKAIDVVAALNQAEARDDLAARLESEFDLELREEAERRVRLRVASTTWEAFRLAAVEGLPGIEVADRLGMKVAAVFMAKSNVLKRLQDEVQILSGA
jgi:RNA polymerase sigma-70 factor (ECF subfamily)